MPSSHCASVVSNKSICRTANVEERVNSNETIGRTLDDRFCRLKFAQAGIVDQCLSTGGPDGSGLLELVFISCNQHNH
jgi:hypothetical protein